MHRFVGTPTHTPTTLYDHFEFDARLTWLHLSYECVHYNRQGWEDSRWQIASIQHQLLAHCGTTMLLFRGSKPDAHNLLHAQKRQSLSPHYFAIGKSFQ